MKTKKFAPAPVRRDSVARRGISRYHRAAISSIMLMDPSLSVPAFKDAGAALRPFVKWAGGKRQLLLEILPRLPEQYGRYFEPFLGGGALLTALQPHAATVNDGNQELINLYTVIRDDLPGLLAALRAHVNDKEHFYRVRALDRSADYASMPAAERAARILYLNKTCYNGLYRVNGKGQFNAPYGYYANPAIADEALLRQVSRFLNKNDITLLTGDFADAVTGAGENDFLYFDPPYAPLSATAHFTGYRAGGFDNSEQTRLRDLCNALHARGCYVMISNSNAPIIRQLYADASIYRIEEVYANRNINSIGDGRGKVAELLIRNYGISPSGSALELRGGNPAKAGFHSIFPTLTLRGIQQYGKNYSRRI